MEWPALQLFHEGQVMPIGHLFRYMTLVQLKAQGGAPRDFPFTLAAGSYALQWFAMLPKEVPGLI